MMNSIVSSTEPCGTPRLSLVYMEDLTCMNWTLSDKYDLNWLNAASAGNIISGEVLTRGGTSLRSPAGKGSRGQVGSLDWI